MMNPTPQQQQALDRIEAFLDNPSAKVFVLKGYAGTGKTTLIGHIAEMVQKKNKTLKIGATTGRAAKILRDKLAPKLKELFHYVDLQHSILVSVKGFDQGRSNAGIATVHSHIYQLEKVDADPDTGKQLSLFEQKKLGYDDKNSYQLIFRLKTDLTSGIFIIDEASMIADQVNHNEETRFGSGNLLQDLFDSHPSYKFIFVGDPAQLPPVNQSFSPALDENYMKEKYRVNVDSFMLRQIMRIKNPNDDILLGASFLRYQVENYKNYDKFALYLEHIQNVEIHFENNFINLYAFQLHHKWKTEGNKGLFDALNRRILVAPFWNQVQENNRKIRQIIFGNQLSDIMVGDILMVTHNNQLHRLFNGDLIQVIDIPGYSGVHYRNGVPLLLVRVKRLSDGRKITLYLLMDVLHNPKGKFPAEQRKLLMQDFFRRMYKEKIPQNSQKFLDRFANDPYVNALHAVYGYALTCHKAQGGEWQEVFVDLPFKWPRPNKRKSPGEYIRDIYRWVYTAITRTQQKLTIKRQRYIKSFNPIRPLAEKIARDDTENH